MSKILKTDEVLNSTPAIKPEFLEEAISLGLKEGLDFTVQHEKTGTILDLQHGNRKSRRKFFTIFKKK